MTSNRTTKVPARLPEWLVKCLWRGTSVTLRLPARTAEDAWLAAWKQVKHMLGGSSCMEIKVLGKVV